MQLNLSLGSILCKKHKSFKNGKLKQWAYSIARVLAPIARSPLLTNTSSLRISPAARVTGRSVTAAASSVSLAKITKVT